MVTSVGHETNDKVQAAGKNLLLYIFSLMKTGELHDLNNEAWIRPSEKLLESLTVLLKQEQRAITFVVHEGIAQVNNHALWLDRSTLEQAQDLEQYLGAREAGGIIFLSKPSEEQLKKFFFTLARFRPSADSDEPLRELQDQIESEDIDQIKVAPQPLRLDGIGQGVRGVNALWFFAKADAGVRDLLQRRPIEVRSARRTAQQLVDSCAVEQDLLVGLTLLGDDWSPARSAVNAAVLMASVGRALGMSPVECADLATCAIVHTVGHAYPNPDVDNIPSEAAVASFAFRQVVEGSKYTPALAARIAAAFEWRKAAGMAEEHRGVPGPAPSPWGQLMALTRYYLKQVRGGEQGLGRSPLAVGLELLQTPTIEVDQGLIRAFLAAIGLLPVGTVVELMNGDLAIVSDIEHLRGRHLYNSRPAPLTKTRSIFVERMRDRSGAIIPERQSRVRLGDDGDDGEWTVHRTLVRDGMMDLVIRGLFRRPSTILTQLGVR
ncbi:MAG: hypothetical protein VX589_09275 [Myxococcota bacterium]|nr:hypothetical protein [Myxococcota bacterium]